MARVRRAGIQRAGAGVAVLALAAVLVGCAAPYASDPGHDASSTKQEPSSTDREASTGAPLRREIAVVCESDTVTGLDGTQTSSSFVVLLPPGTAIPAGFGSFECHLG